MNKPVYIGMLSFICFLGIICLVVSVFSIKMIAKTLPQKTETIIARPRIIQTGVSIVKDFYNQEKLMLSYSIDGLPQPVLLDEPFGETLPQYQAYLRSIGDFSILGIVSE